jgi:hypothetical protein
MKSLVKQSLNRNLKKTSILIWKIGQKTEIAIHRIINRKKYILFVYSVKKNFKLKLVQSQKKI